MAKLLPLWPTGFNR